MCNRLWIEARLLIIRCLSSVEGRLGLMASLEPCVDGCVVALVRGMECLPYHRALRVRHELTVILEEEPLNGLANHSSRTPKIRHRRRKSVAGSRRRTPWQNGSARLLRYCCETLCESIARLVTDAPAMTDPQAEAPAGSGPGTQRKTAPCRQVTVSPCQQSVEDPFENPVTPVPGMNDNESTGCLP